MKDYRVLFGYAAILMAMGFLVRSFSPANAYNGPMVKTGENPSRSFYGTVSQSSNLDILTTAIDEVFIVTSCYVGESSYMDFYSSNGKILDGRFCSMPNLSLSHGNGRLVVPSASTLRITNTFTNYGFEYYVEGYYAYAP